MGRARKADSGFVNQWVDNEHSFDNAFYRDILDKTLNWIQVCTAMQNVKNPITVSENLCCGSMSTEFIFFVSFCAKRTENLIAHMRKASSFCFYC